MNKTASYRDEIVRARARGPALGEQGLWEDHLTVVGEIPEANERGIVLREKHQLSTADVGDYVHSVVADMVAEIWETAEENTFWVFFPEE